MLGIFLKNPPDGADHGLKCIESKNQHHSKKQISYDKQLYLLSLILQKGGFQGITHFKIDTAYFVPIKPNAKEVQIPTHLESLEEFELKLGKLLSAYLKPVTGFKARRALFLKEDYSPYDQISRYGEWDTSDKFEVEIL